jgi:hypothetical protein
MIFGWQIVNGEIITIDSDLYTIDETIPLNTAYDTPVGIDVFVQMMQQLQQRELPDIFGISEAKMLFYGRGEILTVDEVPVKVVFMSGKDYRKLMYIDKFNFVSYLMIEGNPEFDGMLERTNVSLYCHGDLKKLFPFTTSHRADEEMRKTMKEFVYRLIEPQNMRSIEIIEDMQPYHSFKINFTIV